MGNRLERFGTLKELALLATAPAAMALFVFHSVALGGRTFVLRDSLRLTLPAREFLARTLKEGRLPEWNDRIGFGVAFAANPVHGALAPLGWLHGLLPLETGTDLVALSYLAIAGLGAGLFSRRLGANVGGALLAGALLVASGYFTSMVTNGMAAIVAWTPWLAWAADRAARASPGARLCAALPLALVIAFHLTGGEPATILAGGWLAVLVTLARSEKRSFALLVLGAAGAAGAGLAAAALLPALRVLFESVRAGGFDFATAAAWSMHPLRLLELVSPMALGGWGNVGWFGRLLMPGDPFWAPSLAFGAVPLLLVLAAGKAGAPRLLFWGSLGFVVLGLGRFTPAYELYRVVFLPEGLARYPEKYLVGAVVLWSALAGVGFTQLTGGTARKFLAWSATALSLGLALGTLLLETGLRNTLSSALAARASAQKLLLDPELGLRAVSAGIGATAAACALFAFAAFRAGKTKAPTQTGLWVFAACLTPLLVASWHEARLTPRRVLSERPAVLEGFNLGPRGAFLPRVYVGPDLDPPAHFADAADLARRFNETLAVNLGARNGLDVLPADDSSADRRSVRFWKSVFPRMTWEGVTRLLSLDAVVLHPQMTAQTGLPTEARNDLGWERQSTGNVRPHAFVAPRWGVAPSFEAAQDELATPNRWRDPAKIVLLASDVPDPGGSPSVPLTACLSASVRPERLDLDCETPVDGYAVVLDALTSGWSATVDEAPVPLVLADGLFRAVHLSPGRHRVTLNYETPGLRLGAKISAVFFALFGLAAWRSGRR